MTITPFPGTKQAALTELTEGLTTKALNDPSEATAVLRGWETKMADKAPVDGGDVLAACVSGLHDGSVAVAHRWIERHPFCALAYWAGPETTKKYLEEEGLVPPVA